MNTALKFMAILAMAALAGNVVYGISHGHIAITFFAILAAMVTTAYIVFLPTHPHQPWTPKDDEEFI